jgi:hypothetical protein
MGCPDPIELRARKRYGREEYVQDLLACLIVAGDAPRWNTPTLPTSRGRRLLADIAAHAGVKLDEGAPLMFVNEFELLRRHESELSGWPDFAIVCPDRLILIELKTESASHRRGQLAHYTDLAAFRHPGKQRTLIYLTPPLARNAALDPIPFCHVFWDDVATIIERTWADAPTDEQRVAAFLADFLKRLDERWVGATTAPRIPATMTVAGDSRLLELAVQVAADGRQRAADIEWTDPEQMDEIRVALRNTLGASATPVRPWIWNATSSGGKALTDSGRRLGYELRFSRSRRAGG